MLLTCCQTSSGRVSLAVVLQAEFRTVLANSLVCEWLRVYDANGLVENPNRAKSGKVLAGVLAEKGVPVRFRISPGSDDTPYLTGR